MKKLSLAESIPFADVNNLPSQFVAECWFDDACILDMDYFVKTLAGIKAKGVRPEFIGSVIVHYASKWLPDLSSDEITTTTTTTTQVGSSLNNHTFEDPLSSPESVTSQWLKKRFFVETLVGILPPEKNSVPCSFLLRLLRTANMVGAEPGYRAELEKKVAWQMDHASLKELMIPSFSHTCGTLLDVGLVLRLVKRFLRLLEEAAAASNGESLVKVVKLVDGYLAEAALDSGLSVLEFMGLAGALPSHARSMDDGLYRAIDTYLKAHPNVSKHDRKNLCRLMDSRKLSMEASFHAAQNERLPVRSVMQVLFSEYTKLSRSHLEWSGSFTTPRSPSNCITSLDPPARCHSKREAVAQQAEIRRLREDVQRLQGQCNSMQEQIERMSEKKKLGFFRWKTLGLMPNSLAKSWTGKTHHEGEAGFGRLTPVDMKTKLVKGRTPPKCRQSMS